MISKLKISKMAKKTLGIISYNHTTSKQNYLTRLKNLKASKLICNKLKRDLGLRTSKASLY
jgi:hypothetical protein